MNESHVRVFGGSFTQMTSNAVFATAVSLFPFGALVGALLGGWLADRYGRRRTLHVNNAVSVLGVGLLVGSCFAEFYPCFHFGRLVIGAAAGELSVRRHPATQECSGVGSTVAPLYVTELCPVRYRGAFGAMAQLTGAVSMVISQALGLRVVLGTRSLWRWIFRRSLVLRVASGYLAFSCTRCTGACPSDCAVLCA